MERRFMITHYYHSGFSVACGEILLVFDYWRGEENELAVNRQLTPEKLKAFSHVYVLISHDHPDHMDPVVFSWKDEADVSYIVASDVPVGTRGKRMAPGDTLSLADGLTVTAYDSTDLGVSFLVHCFGLNIFHAGDLNFWHWREESTMQEIEEADREFRKAIDPLSSEKIDVAFFPLDPRQGSMFEAGANYFILSVKPRILIPMHYFHRTDVAMDYARTASCRSTEVIALPAYGERLLVSMDEEGYLNLSFPGVEDNRENRNEKPAEGMTEDDPFMESDLPLDQLARSEDDPDRKDM